jgi:hypothetical protein
MLKSYHVIIAGGAITSLFTNSDINDVDIYFKSQNYLSDFLYNEMYANWVIAYTDKAFLFKCNGIKLQTVYFGYFSKAEDIFDTFDFTVCMGAFDFDTEQFILHQDFLKHNASKILRFNSNTAFPIISALRIDKYKNKGYSISKSEFLRIMLTLINSNISNYDDLKVQIGGMYGENYDNLLQPKNDEEFSISKIVENMKYLNLEKDYFVLPSKTTIDDWDLFVYEILKEKVKYFTYNNQKYRMVHGELEKIYKTVDDKYIKVNIDDVVKFPLIRYKYVKHCKDDTLRSYYDNSFVWSIGENVAKNKTNGLFGVKKTELDNASYHNEKDAVLIELIIESIDDVNRVENLLDGTCDFKRVIATRIVPKEEVEQMIKNNKEDFISIIEP